MINVIKKIVSIYDGINRILVFLVGLIIVFTMLSVSADVIGRYFLRRPIGWVLEITEYCLLYIPFLAAAWLLKQNGHVRIDVLVTRFKPKTQAFINFTTSLLGAITCAFSAYYGAATTLDHYKRGLIDTKILEVPKHLVIMVIPLGFFLLAIEFLRKGFVYLQKR